jgi:hypothetical protein
MVQFLPFIRSFNQSINKNQGERFTGVIAIGSFADEQAFPH